MILRQQQREKDYKLKRQNDLQNKNSQDLTRAVKVSSPIKHVLFHKHLLEAIWGTFQQEQQSNTSKNNDLSIWAPANIQSIDDSTSNGICTSSGNNTSISACTCYTVFT